MSDIEIRPANLLNPATGEVLPATPENAAAMIAALRRLRAQASDAIKACEALLIEESRRVGTKTLHFGAATATVKGGSEVVWDIEALRGGLMLVGCPEERIDELIVATVEYRVNNAVARQLAAANPDYAHIIESARGRVEKPTYVSVKEER